MYISKEDKPLKNILVSTKDKDTITKKNSVIYWFRCDKIDCDEQYIGESSRTFAERYKEHLRAPSPIFEHQSNTSHITAVGNFRIISREGNNMARIIKEGIYKRVNNPTLNKNIGNCNLPQSSVFHPRTENK